MLLNNAIIKYNIKQVFVSKALKHFEIRFLNKFKLKKYYNCNLPSIFFGVYFNSDIKKIIYHKSTKIIIYGGSDSNYDINFLKKSHNLNRAYYPFFLKKLKNIEVLSISKNIKDLLFKVNIKSTLINFNLLTNNLFKLITNFNNSIYIYSGYKYERGFIYGKKYYSKIIKLLKSFNFILSHKINVKYENMPDIYNKCFIGLRLTINDGNANTVQEMEKMGLMVVHNGNHLNSLKWKNEDDIIYHITIEFINKYLSAKKYTDKIFNSYVIISNHKNFMNLNSNINEITKNKNIILYWNFNSNKEKINKSKVAFYFNKIEFLNYLNKNSNKIKNNIYF